MIKGRIFCFIDDPSSSFMENKESALLDVSINSSTDFRTPYAANITPACHVDEVMKKLNGIAFASHLVG
jgi:hypothetical protein